MKKYTIPTGYLFVDGLVTCGNVVLGGSKLKYDEDSIKIIGL